MIKAVRSKAMPQVFEDSWKQQKADDISDALHELLQTGGVDEAMRAIDYAINIWVDYHHEEKEKWNALKAKIKTL